MELHFYWNDVYDDDRGDVRDDDRGFLQALFFIYIHR